MNSPSLALFRTQGLHLPDSPTASPDDLGVYNYSVDAVLSYNAQHEVTRHEVVHRIFSHSYKAGSDFHVLQSLVGISHGLIWCLLDVAHAERATLQGLTLQEMRVEGGSKQSESAISEILRRLQYVETIISAGAIGVAPYAEMAAIDFAEGVDPSFPTSRLSKNYDMDADQRRLVDQENDALFDAVLSHYDDEFGGYHLSAYLGFRNALRHVWSIYKEIPGAVDRQHFLALCMSGMYLGDDGRIMFMDRIAEAQENAVAFLAKEHNPYTMVARQLSISTNASRIPDVLREQLLEDLPGSARDAEQFMGIFQTILRAMVDAKPSHPSLLAFYGGPAGSGPLYSFLRFYPGGPQHEVWVNPWFFREETLRELRLDPPASWWRRLLFCESLRQSILDGAEPICPLRGWHQRTDANEAEFGCDDKCPIRKYGEVAQAIGIGYATCDRRLT